PSERDPIALTRTSSFPTRRVAHCAPHSEKTRAATGLPSTCVAHTAKPRAAALCILILPGGLVGSRHYREAFAWACRADHALAPRLVAGAAFRGGGTRRPKINQRSGPQDDFDAIVVLVHELV